MQAFTPAKKQEYSSETQDWIVPMLELAKENFPKQIPIYDRMLRTLNWQIDYHTREA